MRPVIYIDPQSIRNLAIYDYSLLCHIEEEVHYCCSTFYDHKPLPSYVKPHPLFKYNNMSNNVAKAISYLFSYLLIFFLLIRVRPKAIHLQWMRIPMFDVWFLKIAKRITGCKIIYTAHNILPHDTGKRHIDIFQKMYEVADTIIVHTHITKKELLSSFNIPSHKVVVIDHGLLEIVYNTELLKSQEEDYSRKYQLDGKMVFSSLGYQYYYKGVDLLAEAWASTPELSENKYCKLLLVGKDRGADLSIVRNVDNVIVDDRVISNEEFYYLLTHTDVYLLPYRKISQSGVLLTAISTGTPFLVSNIGGLTEPLEIASVGWTIDELTVDGIRKKLLWLLHHPEEVKAAKNNQQGWKKLRCHYDWERIGKLTQQIYIR